MAKTHVTMTINGQEVEALVEPRTLLIHFLREQMLLTGPHIGCETSHCGACTVDMNEMSVKSCSCSPFRRMVLTSRRLKAWRQQTAR